MDDCTETVKPPSPLDRLWAAMHTPDLGSAEARVLFHLVYYDGPGGCQPSLDGIAKSMGVHVRNIRRAVASLEERGFVKRHDRRPRPTRYTLHLPEAPPAPHRLTGRQRPVEPGEVQPGENARLNRAKMSSEPLQPGENARLTGRKRPVNWKEQESKKELEGNGETRAREDAPTLQPDDSISEGKQTELMLPIQGGKALDELAEAVALYNEAAERSGFRAAQHLTEDRKTQLRRRLKDAGGIEGWKAALDKAAGSAFCRGERDGGWPIDLDFMLKERNFTRLMEGSYDDNDRVDAELAKAREYLKDPPFGSGGYTPHPSPARATKPCSWPGCGDLADAVDAFCDRHQAQHERRMQEHREAMAS